MNDEQGSARVRRRCVWWLSGKCHGGQECLCLPWPLPANESKKKEDEPDYADRRG